jgi:hypothetical protein
MKTTIPQAREGSIVNRMRITFCGLLVGLICLFASATAQVTYPELKWFPALMDTLMRGYYAAADSICDSIEAENPGHPVSQYARATVLYTHVFDFEDSTGYGKFMALTDACIGLAQQRKSSANGEAKAVLCYLRGSALSSRGLMLRHENNLLAGLKSLVESGSEFNDAIELNPRFYDAYLGRGAYRYAVASNASALRWLPFIPSKESGWRDLWLAVDSSKYSTFPALSAMVWFVLDEGNYALVDSICQAGLARFPDSRNFLWPLMSMQVRQKRWADVEVTAQALLKHFLNHPDNNGYDATGLYWRLMLCADELGQPEQAKAYAQAGLATYRTANATARRAEKLRAMQDRLNK